ncbi:NDP-sugar synthase [bacterium]|nr:NDP-sugar synthase [bacterium]
MDAIILSAGEGTRLRPMTLHRPKPLMPVLCEPIFEHIVSSLSSNGISRAAVNLHYLGERFAAYLNLRRASNIELRPVFEDNILGTGGGISNAAAVLDGDGPILVHNGDVYAEIDLAEAIGSHGKSGALVTLLVRDGTPEIATNGDIVDDIAGRLANNGAARHQFTGISIWERDAISALPRPGTSGCAIDAICRLIVSHPESVRAFHIGDALWCDIGTPAAYLDLHRRLIGERELFPKGFSPAKDTVIEGFLCACEGARIGAGCRLRDVIVWPDGNIPPKTRLENAIVGPFGIFRA